MLNAMMIDGKDNVAVAIEPDHQGRDRHLPVRRAKRSSLTARGGYYDLSQAGCPQDCDRRAGCQVRRAHRPGGPCDIEGRRARPLYTTWKSHRENLDSRRLIRRIRDMTFYGYKRPDGRVGVRNKVLILPASVCASDTARIICPAGGGLRSPSTTSWAARRLLPTSSTPWTLWQATLQTPTCTARLSYRWAARTARWIWL